MTTAPGSRFAFGRNWQKFNESADQRCIDAAVASIKAFMRVDDLRGRSFLDVGCGSGLFSYAAHLLGASRILSFDIDPASVRCCDDWRRRAGRPSSWSCIEGSILNDGFVSELGRFDVVYAWGSLHHTGHMWRALCNSVGLVRPGGYLYLSIYNHKQGPRGSDAWLKVKRFYNTQSQAGKRVLEALYLGYTYQSKLVRGKNPWRIAREFHVKRGMDWHTDLVDWLGGYPYEFASPEQVFRFVDGLRPGTLLDNITETDGLGTNSFLFKTP